METSGFPGLKARLKSDDRLWAAVTASPAMLAHGKFRAGSHGRRNRLEIAGTALIRGLRVDVRGNDNLVVIGARAWVRGLRITIRGNSNRIILGRDTEFSGPGVLWVEDDHGELRIGDSSTIEPGCTLAVLEGQDLTVGPDCMIAAEVEIRTGDSHRLFDGDAGDRINESAPVVLGEHVWVGKNSIILKGVELASGVAVGTGSVVTHSVEESGSVVVGNPARVVRRNVRWQR